MARNAKWGIIRLNLIISFPIWRDLRLSLFSLDIRDVSQRGEVNYLFFSHVKNRRHANFTHNSNIIPTGRKMSGKT